MKYNARIEPDLDLFVVCQVPELYQPVVVYAANTKQSHQSIWTLRKAITDNLDAVAVWSVPRGVNVVADHKGRHNGEFWGWIQA